MDENVLISAAWKAEAEVTAIWRLEAVRLVTSIYVMAEVERNLFQVSQIERLRSLMTSVEILLPEPEETPPEIPELLLLPLKDRHVLAAAMQARAHYLITGDKRHFGLLFGKTISGTKIVPPSDLLSHFRLRHP